MDDQRHRPLGVTMRIKQWVELFKTGDYGDKGKFTTAELDQMVANFNAANRVPVVIGHPKTEDRAFGWISSLKREGELLLGRLDQLHPTVQTALAEGAYRNHSIKAVKTPDKGWRLAHLGLLGAVPPAVEGLQPIAAFAEQGETVEITFNEPGEPPGQQAEMTMADEQEMARLKEQVAQQGKELEAARAAQAKAEQDRKQSAFAAWFDQQAEAARLPPGRRSEVVSFLLALDSGPAAATFAWDEGGERHAEERVGWFKKFIESMPSAEFANPLPPGPAQGSGEPVADLAKHV